MIAEKKFGVKGYIREKGVSRADKIAYYLSNNIIDAEKIKQMDFRVVYEYYYLKRLNEVNKLIGITDD